MLYRQRTGTVSRTKQIVTSLLTKSKHLCSETRLRTFQTYLNTRPRLSYEPLSTYTAELNHHVRQALPGYGGTAIVSGEKFLPPVDSNRDRLTADELGQVTFLQSNKCF